MSEAYKPCDFDREFYLEDAEVYQQVGLHDADHELCEFNEDPEELAFELAYTRHALAVLEKQNEVLRKTNVGMADTVTRMYEEVAALEKQVAELEFDKWVLMAATKAEIRDSKKQVAELEEGQKEAVDLYRAYKSATWRLIKRANSAEDRAQSSQIALDALAVELSERCPSFECEFVDRCGGSCGLIYELNGGPYAYANSED